MQVITPGPYEQIVLTQSFDEKNPTRAQNALRLYFEPLSGKNGGFTGGRWDTFERPDRSPNRFTAEDVVACALLATPIRGRAAHDLLQDRAGRFSGLLEKIDPDQDFVDIEVDSDPIYTAMNELYDELKKLPDVGRTRTTKLMARKRPRLVPILDNVVVAHAFPTGCGDRWAALHAALRANDRRLWNWLKELTATLELGSVSVLRVFDVLTWMDGSGNAKDVATSR